MYKNRWRTMAKYIYDNLTRIRQILLNLVAHQTAVWKLGVI
jgi:hypothetical protein